MKNIDNPLIFVAEDDFFFRELIVQKLESYEFSNIKVFNNGNDCVNTLYSRPDIIILDYRLGDVDGGYVLSMVKKISPESKVIFLSAQTNIEATVKALKEGAHDYLVKDHMALSHLVFVIKDIIATHKIKMKRKKYLMYRAAFATLVGLAVLSFIIIDLIK